MPMCRFEEIATTDAVTGSRPEQVQQGLQQAGVSGVQHTAGAELHDQSSAAQHAVNVNANS